jgi:hypothetical protein
VRDVTESSGSAAPVRSFSRGQVLVLVALTFAGLVVRALYLHDRAPHGDEVGTLVYARESVGYLLSHSPSWLQMNYFVVLEKGILALFGTGPFSLGLVPLLAGVAIIPLTAFFARTVSSATIGLCAAALTAVHPLLVEYSAMARSYSLLVAFSLWVLIALSRWRSSHTRRAGIFLALACTLLVLAHPNGSYVLAFVLAMIGYDVLGSRSAPDRRRVLASVGPPMLVSLLALVLSYAWIFPDMVEFGSKFHSRPPTGIGYLPGVWSEYFGSVIGGFLTMGFIAGGAWIALLRQRSLLPLFVFVVLPIGLMSAQGLDHHPWAYPRFLLFTLPVLILLFLQGATDLLSLRFRAPALRVLIPVGMSVVLGAQLMLDLQTLFETKKTRSFLPWEEVSAHIAAEYQEGDTIVGAAAYGAWLYLEAWLPGERYDIVKLEELRRAPETASAGARVFFVTAVKIETRHEHRDFGGLRVVVYPHRSREAFLALLRRDFVNAVRDRAPSAELANHYRVLCQIDQNTPRGQANRERYCQLWKRFTAREPEW